MRPLSDTASWLRLPGNLPHRPRLLLSPGHPDIACSCYLFSHSLNSLAIEYSLLPFLRSGHPVFSLQFRLWIVFLEIPRISDTCSTVKTSYCVISFPLFHAPRHCEEASLCTRPTRQSNLLAPKLAWGLTQQHTQHPQFCTLHFDFCTLKLINRSVLVKYIVVVLLLMDIMPL